GKTVWSEEGVDPVYNIPNTILRATLGTKYIILEMSVEYRNEMDYYLWLAKPDIGIVTNIATTHTEFLKNVEGVASEKSKLIRALSENGVAVLNLEDPTVKSFAKFTKAKVCWYGGASDIYPERVNLNKDLSTSFTLIIGTNKKDIQMEAYGMQFVTNAVAASAAAFSLGLNLANISSGIEKFKLSKHRLNIMISKNFGIIFDDSYNSNPKAASESLDTFIKLADSKTKIAVLGDMLELGMFEELSHKELGKKVGKLGFDYVVGVGRASRFVVEEASKLLTKEKCFLTSNVSEAAMIVKPLLNSKTTLFVKGSRSIHLDKLVDSLI
ncbi:MAG: Mur ligase family protein, partial [Candidatus Woesebacteria bacterium]|nr:Mur ligase family protein [Candidatus Woesebacteria bacterium]